MMGIDGKYGTVVIDATGGTNLPGSRTPAVLCALEAVGSCEAAMELAGPPGSEPACGVSKTEGSNKGSMGSSGETQTGVGM